MKTRSVLATLLLMVAGMQMATAQGFRVYKSDGTVAQYSLRTDSIVFYDNLGSDEGFGPFTPVNALVAGKWYRSKSEWITLNEDGTTTGWDNSWGQGMMGDFVYRFFPYSGNIVVYDKTDKPVSCIRVVDMNSERLVVVENMGNGDMLREYTHTQPIQLVTGISLNPSHLDLELNRTAQLQAYVYPSDADNPAVTWESSDTNVATVDESGLVTAVGDGSCVITCRATDGSNVSNTCGVTVQTVDDSGYIDGHYYVDLQLPSGTLWASTNIGASSSTEYGSYFAWGETSPKQEYTKSSYVWFDSSTNSYAAIYFGSSPYSELWPNHDAATANWGSNWQMPSREQFRELVNSQYTYSGWTTLNGVSVLKVESKVNSNVIYLPAAGWINGTAVGFAGTQGTYWSRSSGMLNDFYFTQSSAGMVSDTSYFGMPVRPVRKQ